MKKKPNIIFVLTDQHRRSALEFWQKDEYKNYLHGEGDPVHTPNLNKLADEGVVVSEAFSNYPVCSPYRGMLFSGRYPSGNGVWLNCAPGRDSELRSEIPTFCDVLADDGYSVGYVGKWHLEKPGPYFDENGKFIRDDKNFSGKKYFANGTGEDTDGCWDTLMTKDRQRKIDYLRMYNTCDIFWSDLRKEYFAKPHYWDKELNRIIAPQGMWTPEYETEMALDFIKNEHGERDSEKPYTLFLGFNPPHSPYRDRRDTDHISYDKYYSKDVLPDAKTLVKRENVTLDDDKFYNNIRTYFSHVSGIDRCFGKILDYIDNSDEKDNTIIIFSADHGEMMGSHGRMAKNVPYEESTGIPFIIRYPKKLKHRVVPMLLSGVDVMPTVLGLCGTPIPQGLDGKDYSQILISGEGEMPKSALYIFETRKGVRTDKYMYTVSVAENEEFRRENIYDIQNDPYQLKNLDRNSIPKEDYKFLVEELGRLLCESRDPWYIERKFADIIVYP